MGAAAGSSAHHHLREKMMIGKNSGGKVTGGTTFDPTQFRGVTDNAGGVFGMAKREVTEFDLKLVYKHQQA